MVSVSHPCLSGEQLNSTPQGSVLLYFPPSRKLSGQRFLPDTFSYFLANKFKKKSKIHTFLSIKHLFYLQVLPYFLRKFQNHVSIFTSKQHTNYFSVFSPGQWDILHTLLASSSQGYQSETFHEKALKYLCCSVKLKEVYIIFRRRSQN